jgi:hypothetical protein
MSGAAAPAGPEMLALQTKLNTYSSLVNLTSIVARAVLYAAIFRAVLEPANSGFFYLRLGKDELWQALLFLCLCVLAVFGVFGLALGGGALGAAGFFLGKLAPEPWTGWVQALAVGAVVVTVLVLVLWVSLRLSLAMPMTFAEKKFRLFESWGLTKGQSWRLLGMALLLVVIMIALELVVGMLVVGLAIGLLGMASFDPAAIEAFFRQSPEVWLKAAWPVIAGVVVVGTMLTGAMLAVLLAPWAEAYRQIASSAPAQA